jgi:hypothetical protein
MSPMLSMFNLPPPERDHGPCRRNETVWLTVAVDSVQAYGVAHPITATDVLCA